MIASQPADQDIEQAIQRLQKKMQDVSDSLDQGRGQMQRKARKNKSKQRSAQSGRGFVRLLKYLFILLLIGATSFILAQIATGYLDSRSLAPAPSTETADTSEETQPAPEVLPQVAQTESGSGSDTQPAPADGIGEGVSALPAKFSMQAANYDVIDSELGPVLDIAITVANIGGAAGRPELFEIELVDEANKQLMKWPMVVSGTAILPQQQMVYKTRLIEPPANFKNIRVTMKK